MDKASVSSPRSPTKSKSFTRMEPSPSKSLNRSRANTVQSEVVQENGVVKTPALTIPENQKHQKEDIFEKNSLISGKEGSLQEIEQMDSPNDIPEDFDELPIELISLIDRFVDSLSAKVHNTPPSIEKLSDIFQEFYLRSEASIATHINTLATRQSRTTSPRSSTSSKSSAAGRDSNAKKPSSRKGTLDLPSGSKPEQQMLTPQEVSERRKARRMLDRKATALEEAVERRVCERVYGRIWRHRSTLDEVRDEKLRSRTAALALVGIGLRDLGIDIESTSKDNQVQAALESDIEDYISKARDGLLKMNEAKYPLGKLQQLAAAHKNIVDLLTTLHHSSSSADEILPTLIYTLITTPPEGINVISNLHFIQRFRAASKVNGEAAYCLVNLEAAITFLETVDLASLRADEALEGPPKSSSGSSTPMNDSKADWLGKGPTSAPSTKSSPAPSIVTSAAPSRAPQPGSPLSSESLTKPSQSMLPSHHRRLSDLFQPPATALGAASEAVRSTADQGLKNISHTLDSSFNFLFGRLQEQKVTREGSNMDGAIVVPKTLDDVRTLVQRTSDGDDDSLHEPSLDRTKSDDSLLSAIAGRRPIPRDRSVDSAQSAGSTEKRVAFASGTQEKPGGASPFKGADPTSAGIGAVESMRNFGSALNPLRGFGGMTGLRGFGRPSSADSSVPTVSSVPPVSNNSSEKARIGAKDLDSDDLPPVKIAPPIPKFMEAKSVGELKLGEMADLLQDYKRLARALDQLGAL